MTVSEALENRDETYSGWEADKLKKDACMDMLKILNVLTDIDNPSIEQIHAMHDLSESIANLHFGECCIHEEKPDWSIEYPSIYSKKRWLDEEFNNFMTEKHNGKSSPESVEKVIKAHNCLSKEVTSMKDITEEEKDKILELTTEM